jgi:chemotaxis protein MotA
LDITTGIGVILGIACILVGQALEGGHVGSILQMTAALIVLGGTFGAVVTQFPLDDLRRALRQARLVFASRADRSDELIAEILELARLSRREGLLALEARAEQATDPFFSRALLAVVDGTESAALRQLLEQTIEQEEQFQECGPKMFEAAGGYAPTIGILGAVLGLIHVMENLSDPSKLGAGIAVAFVATVYGVRSANLLFLPFAQKLKFKVRHDARRKEMIVEGVCAIQEGLNPQVIEKRLRAFLDNGDQ